MKKPDRFRVSRRVAISLYAAGVASCAALSGPNEATRSSDNVKSSANRAGNLNRLPKSWVTGCFEPNRWGNKDDTKCPEWEICGEHSAVLDERITRPKIELEQDRSHAELD